MGDERGDIWDIRAGESVGRELFDVARCPDEEGLLAAERWSIVGCRDPHRERLGRDALIADMGDHYIIELTGLGCVRLEKAGIEEWVDFLSGCGVGYIQAMRNIEFEMRDCECDELCAEARDLMRQLLALAGLLRGGVSL